MSIEQFELEDILAAIRRLFTDIGELEAKDALKQVGEAIGFKRVTAKRRETMRSAMSAAVRRGIVVNVRGVYSIDCKRITDYPDELLEKLLYAAIGRAWWRREDAIKAAARYLGFKRTGAVIQGVFEVIIKRAVRKGGVEREGEMVRRKG